MLGYSCVKSLRITKVLPPSCTSPPSDSLSNRGTCTLTSDMRRLSECGCKIQNTESLDSCGSHCRFEPPDLLTFSLLMKEGKGGMRREAKLVQGRQSRSAGTPRLRTIMMLPILSTFLSEQLLTFFPSNDLVYWNRKENHFTPTPYREGVSHIQHVTLTLTLSTLSLKMKAYDNSSELCQPEELPFPIPFLYVQTHRAEAKV